eukprot:scaffold136968_cov127-Phaeocystis_antarctica.AAC.1
MTVVYMYGGLLQPRGRQHGRASMVWRKHHRVRVKVWGNNCRNLNRAPRVPQRVQEAPNEPGSAALGKHWYSPPQRFGKLSFGTARSRVSARPSPRYRFPMDDA